MAKPATLPSWATDGGTTIEPEPGEKAQGFQAGARAPARKMNWILHWLYRWAAYLDSRFDAGDELVYPTPVTHTRVYTAAHFEPDDPTQWSRTILGGPGAIAAGQPIANDAGGRFILDDIPAGAVVSSIIALVSASVTRTTGNGWRIRVWHSRIDFATPITATAEIGTAIEVLGDGYRYLGPGGLAEAVVEGDHFAVQIIGPDGSLDPSDVLYGVQVTYSTPRPRR